MPRQKTRIPAYCHHKSDDQAVAYVNRKAVYLGKFNSPESRKRYGELVAQLQGNGLPTPAVASPVAFKAPKSLGELCLKFAQEKLPAYSKDEQHCQRGALRMVVDLYAETAAADFGPLKLRAVREGMIRKGWSRSFINKQIARVKHLFRWAISWEYAPSSVADALSTVEALKPGETDAPEFRPRSAVPQEKLDAIRAELRGRYADLWDLSLLVGSRPGELVGLKVGDIDRSGEVWKAELKRHKTLHHGKRRVLFFATSAQQILLRHMKADPGARLFPIQRKSFGDAVKVACERAFGMPDELRKPDKKNLTPEQLADVRAQAATWRREHCITPHWLRHCTATTLADAAGIEAAQKVLGHSNKAMTELYTRMADRQAIEAVKKLG